MHSKHIIFRGQSSLSNNSGLLPFIVFGFILIANISSMLAQGINWQTSLGGTNNENALALLHNTDGSIIVAGTTWSQDGTSSCSHGGTDAWIACLNSNGSMRWRKCLGGSNMDGVNSILACIDGGYLLSAYTNSTDGDVSGFHLDPSSFSSDCWLIKLDSSGNIQWQHCYGGTQDEQAIKSVQLPDSGYAFIAYTNSPDGDVSFIYDSVNLGKDNWIVRTDKNGNILWEKTFGNEEYFEQPSDLKYVAGKGLYVLTTSGQIGGDVPANYGQDDIWLLLFDLNGTIISSRVYGGSGNDEAACILVNTDSTIWIGASSTSFDFDIPGNVGGLDNVLLLLDTTGYIIFSTTAGGSMDDELIRLEHGINNSLYVLSSSSSADYDLPLNYGYKDIWFYKYEYNSGIVFSKNFGGSGDDIASDLLFSGNNECVIAGTSFSNDQDILVQNGQSDIWIAGISILIGIDEISSPKIKIAPNPFSRETTFVLSGSHADFADAQISIYDLSGKCISGPLQFSGTVYTFENKILNPGVYAFKISSTSQTPLHGLMVVCSD